MMAVTSRPEFAHPPLKRVAFNIFTSEEQFPWWPRTDWLLEGDQDWAVATGILEGEERELWVPGRGGVIRHRVAPVSLLLERTHFCFEWSDDDGPYPRYEALRDLLVPLLSRWPDRDVTPSDGSFYWWQLKYHNEFPVSAEWQGRTAAEFSPVLPTASRVRVSLGTPYHSSLGWKIESQQMHLSVTAEELPGDDESEARFLLTLTATGDPDSLGSLLQRFDAARDVIVRTFEEITTPAAHAYWGLKKRTR